MDFRLRNLCLKMNTNNPFKISDLDYLPLNAAIAKMRHSFQDEVFEDGDIQIDTEKSFPSYPPPKDEYGEIIKTFFVFN